MRKYIFISINYYANVKIFNIFY